MKFYTQSGKDDIQEIDGSFTGVDFSVSCNIIEFPGIPIAESRPRTRVQGLDRKGKPIPGKKIFAQIYTVTAKHKAKLLPLIPELDFPDKPTLFYCLAVYTPPASWSKKKHEAVIGTHKVTKPDGTNILKFYEDLLEGRFMPKDQFINPTICERIYGYDNFTVIATVPIDAVRRNIPDMIKKFYSLTPLM